jgi:hypothetical protein
MFFVVLRRNSAMKLEHGKRYLTRSGMITPPLNSRHGGISFDLPDVGDLSSGIRWLPNGRCETAGITGMASNEFDLVAEMHEDGGMQR